MTHRSRRGISVYSGRFGARVAAKTADAVIVVDALRASATLASLLELGVTEALVVERTSQAFAERDRLAGALLVGERGGVMIEGFDLGNSPLTEQPAQIGGVAGRRVIFTSSNCSACCVAAAGASRVWLGTTVTASAVRELITLAEGDLAFVTAGAAEDPARLVIEDLIAVGAIVAPLVGPNADGFVLGNDGARAAVAVHRWALAEGLETAFLASDNGRRLSELGFDRDVRVAAELDRYRVVPELLGVRELAGGGIGAIFGPAARELSPGER